MQQTIASVERRVEAIEAALEARGMKPGEFVDQATQVADEKWVPQNGARVVAKAWTDAAFRRRLIENGIAAVAELGIEMPRHHRHLVVL
jgi:nitrile hydratase